MLKCQITNTSLVTYDTLAVFDSWTNRSFQLDIFSESNEPVQDSLRAYFYISEIARVMH